jgi:hypothetical protein
MSGYGLDALGEDLLQEVNLRFLVTPPIGGRGI